jgi:Na+-transporting methylmalonyl-CoA/oxaloacetate decarboxylase beta subunit
MVAAGVAAVPQAARIIEATTSKPSKLTKCFFMI